MNSYIPASQYEKFREGIALFNLGEFFRAHEVWEEIWLVTSGRDKILMQGLIQLAAAFHHIRRGNPEGASSLIAASLLKLEKFPEIDYGIQLGILRRAARESLKGPETESDPQLERLPRIELADTT
jgi:uncharacterized protein